MANFRMDYVSYDKLLDSLKELKEKYGFSGMEFITDMRIVDIDDDKENPHGTLLFRLREPGKAGERPRYGTLAVVPERLAEKLN